MSHTQTHTHTHTHNTAYLRTCYPSNPHDIQICPFRRTFSKTFLRLTVYVHHLMTLKSVIESLLCGLVH